MNYREVYKFEDVIRDIALKLMNCPDKSISKKLSFDTFENLVTSRALGLCQKYDFSFLEKLNLEEKYIFNYRKENPEPLRTEKCLIDYIVKFIESEIKGDQ